MHLYKYLKTAIFILLIFLMYSSVAHSEEYNNSSDLTPSTGSASEYNSYPKVTTIEKQLYRNSYQNEDVYKRLSRIENTLFGKSNDDLSLADRVEAIEGKVDKPASNSFNEDNNNDDEYSSPSNSEDYSYPKPGNLSNRDISEMEDRIFDRTYNNENALSRLQRLEKTLLGAVQSGDTDTRMEKLKIASQQNYLGNFNIPSFKNSDPYYNSPSSSSSSYNQYNFSPSGEQGLLDYLLPMVMPLLQNLLNYNNPNNYNNSTFETDPFFNQNKSPNYYRNNYTNQGCAAGVRIMD